MIRRTLLTLVALLLVVGVSACGGGGTDDNADDRPRDEDGSGEGAADESSGDTLPTAEEEAAGTTVPADASDGGSDGRPDPPAPGEPGAVATALGIDRAFTGEGSDELCDRMADIQAGATADLSTAELANHMADITPPTEIATEWELVSSVLHTLASDSSGDALADMTDEEADAWGAANSVVAAYLGDVCGLAG